MCGIVGYIGNDNASKILLEGLYKLEYRGYDSSGLALFSDSGAKVIKSVGRIKNLDEKVGNTTETIGIAHTRWATHGVPSEENAHPHVSENGKITLVHNGVIENYLELKEKYLASVNFYSETDTEVIPNVIQVFLSEGMTMKEAIIRLIAEIDGSYAFAILNNDESGLMYVVRNKSPLLLGEGTGFNMLGSDALAMYKYTKNVIEIKDKEFAIVTASSIDIFNSNGDSVERNSFEIKIDATDGDKGVFDTYMMKEIYDQPSVIRKVLSEYLDNDNNVKIDEEILRAVKDAKSIKIIASGTSSYAGMLMQSYMEKHLEKSVTVHSAGEFAYDTPYIEKEDLAIIISQSGETADCRSALVEAKKRGLKILTLTNTEGSTLVREADMSMLLYAGREIAVASTKAYIAQVSTLAILAYNKNTNLDLYSELSKVANIIEHITIDHSNVEQVVKDNLLNTDHCFYFGRAEDYKLSLEGALKLKEISYIHTEGMSSSELKHGPIALISNGTPVIFSITQGRIASSTRSNIQEVEARGANVTTIVMNKYSMPTDTFTFDDVDDAVAPMIAMIYMQLISYYTALHLGKDIDKPRNLAKSVTVE